MGSPQSSLRSQVVSGPRVRPDLATIPAYRPGRSADTRSHGAPALKISSNENPYPPLPSVLAAIADAGATVNRYPDMFGAALVGEIAARLGVATDRVVLGPGSVGVLQQLVTAMAGPGDEVVFAWRSFEAYPIVTRVAGATPVPVPLLADGRHDLEAMAGAVTERTRVMLVCSPNNPTGTIVTARGLERLLDEVPSDVLVVLDEAYVELVRDEDAADGLGALSRHANVALLRTFSKAYGLAGLRVGYGVAHDPVASALRTTAIPFGVSSVAQAAALASLGCEDELMERVDAIVAERGRVVRALASQGWRVPVTQANFVWFGLGDASGRLAAACADAGLVVRTFDGEGVRATIGEPEANDRLIAVAAGLAATLAG